MELRKPEQTAVDDAIGGIEAQQDVKQLRLRKVESGYAPHGDKRQEPEAERAVHIPIQSRKTCAPVDCQAASPMCAAWPPDDRTGEHEQYQTDRADAVQHVTGRPCQPGPVKTHQPFHRERRRDLIAEYDRGAGDAHQEHKDANSRADQEMQPKHDLSKGGLLGMVAPSFPDCHLAIDSMISRRQLPVRSAQIATSEWNPKHS